MASRLDVTTGPPSALCKPNAPQQSESGTGRSRFSWNQDRIQFSLPTMNSSTMSYACESVYCTGGDFMKYADGPRMGPDNPRSFAILAHRIASMTTPAELGLSQTSSFNSTFSGTSPKLVPSSLMYAHLRSESQGTWSLGPM